MGLVFKKGDPQLSNYGKKGGSVQSENKSVAARIRALKRYGIHKDTDFNWIIERISNPQASVFHIEQILEQRKNELDPEKYIDLLIRVHKLRFGEKFTIQNNHLDVNKMVEFVYQKRKEKQKQLVSERANEIIDAQELVQVHNT